MYEIMILILKVYYLTQESIFQTNISDTKENYKLNREIISDYAESNKNQFEDFFIKGNIDQYN